MAESDTPSNGHDLAVDDVPEWVQRRMTKRQWDFVNAWFGEARFCATTAARLIGYDNPNTTSVHGSRLYRNVRVQAEISRRIRTEVMDRDEIMARLREQVETGVTALRHCFYTSRGKVPRRCLDLDKVHRLGLGHLIRKITPTRYGDTVEMYDGQEALIRCGMTQGLFAERHIHSQDLSDLDNKSLEELRELDDKINGKPKRLGSR